MRSMTILAAVAAAAMPVAAAQAQDYGWRGDSQGWDPSHSYDRSYHEHRTMGPDDRVYRGHDGRYYCKRSNGTTGLVLGAVGGGVVGNALGGGTLGTLLGAGGGALLGRHLDKRHDEAQNRRNGIYCD